MNDLVEFCNIIGRKIGIIIFYDVNSINFLINYIEQITRSKNIMNLIRENFVFYPILDDTKEGKKIQELILDDNNNNELILATFIFYFNQHNNENPDLNTILNKNNIINISKVISTDINTFYSSLIEISNKYLNKNQNNMNLNYSLESYLGLLTNGELLKNKNFEKEKLEGKAQMKEAQLNKEKIRQNKNDALIEINKIGLNNVEINEIKNFNQEEQKKKHIEQIQMIKNNYLENVKNKYKLKQIFQYLPKKK